MIKSLFEIIYIIWVVLANVLTFCGYTRLKEAQTNCKNIYEKYEQSANSINYIYDENKALLNDMGNDTKKAFEALNKASIILSRNNLKQKEYFSQTKNSPAELQQVEKVKKISARFSNALSASVSASGGGALAAGSWALVSVVGTASTGTAISTLSGVAATNATLAWFGGGTLAAGGAGIAGGTLVLGTIFLSPFFFIWAYFTHKKSRQLEKECAKIELIILDLKSKEADAYIENILIKSKICGVKEVCSNFTNVVDIANSHLYEYGYFTHLMRLIRKLMGYGYFKDTEQKFITSLESEVDSFLVAFGEKQAQPIKNTEITN